MVTKQTYRVLIVDDQRDVRRVLRSALETTSHDIKVIDVPSGEEAILVISRQPIDLLISDVRLPGISGLELKGRAQVRNPNLRFILITGMLDTKTRQAVANAGADAYFFKPVEMTPFLNAVEACLGLETQEETLLVEPQLSTIMPATSLPQPPASPASLPEAKPAANSGQVERLSVLRYELNAACVALVDESTQVVAQSGTLPEGMDKVLLFSALMGAINAGEKVSSLLGTGQAQDWQYFAGQPYDFFTTAVSSTTGLIVAAPHAFLQGQRISSLISAMHSAAQDLNKGLANIGGGQVEVRPTAVARPAPAPAEDPIGEDLLSTLDAIFGSAKSSSFKVEDANAFWESAAQESARNISGSDALSYEQARQLGLAPEGN